jgi:ribosomal protein L21E
MSEADGERALNRYIVLHETREHMKINAKKVNQEFKQLNDSIHTYLQTQPGNLKRVNAKYSIQLRNKKKTSGLNIPLIGDGYVEFHGAHGRAVADAERDSFLVSLKALRKTKTDIIQEVSIIIA